MRRGPRAGLRHAGGGRRRITAPVMNIGAAVLLALVPATLARAGDPADVAAAVSHKIMSPFCPGVTLHDCPSREADELRRQIETWAGAGMTEDGIIDRLYAEYGDVIRATPAAEGSGLIAWVVPGLLALTALGAAAVLARRFSDRAASAPEGRRISGAERARLDAELRAYEAERGR